MQNQNTKVYKGKYQTDRWGSYNGNWACIQAIIQVAAEVARVMVQAMAVASAGNNQWAQNAGPKLGRSIKKQLTFDLGSTDKYVELRNFKMEVKYMFQNYNINQAESMPITKKKWLGRQGLQLLKLLTQAEQELFNAEEGLFETLSNKCKLQYNETIKSL